MATGTLGSSARDYSRKESHYLTSGTLTSGTGGNWLAGASMKMGTIPAGSSIRAVTACNSVVNNAVTQGISLGTASGGTDVVAAATGTSTTPISSLGPVSATVAASSVGVILAADTDIWVTNKSSGSVATTGTHSFVVEFICTGGGASPLT